MSTSNPTDYLSKIQSLDEDFQVYNRVFETRKCDCEPVQQRLWYRSERIRVSRSPERRLLCRAGILSGHLGAGN